MEQMKEYAYFLRFLLVMLFDFVKLLTIAGLRDPL